MSVLELSDEFEEEFQTEKREIKARQMPRSNETRDLIAAALQTAILDKLAENESLDINLVRIAVLDAFNKAMSPNYTVKSIMQSSGMVTLFVEGFESFDLEKLQTLADVRS